MALGKRISAFSRLRLALRDIESELNFGHLTDAELDLLALAIEVSRSSPSFRRSAVVSGQASIATAYRAFKSLEFKGYVQPNRVANHTEYRLAKSFSVL